MLVRDAVEADLPAILEIYNDAVLNTTAIWNDIVVDLANRAAWLAERQGQGFPVLVAIAEDGTAAGYATYGPFRPHDGYRHTVENSVYVRGGQRGRGVGYALLTALVAHGQTAGLHAMVAAIEAQNTASIRLHAAHGFAEVGHMPQVGAKFGRWLDLTLMQRQLDHAKTPPA